MAGSLLDARGHLTKAGLTALAAAPLGRGPKELATHLASCPGCQERMLAGASVGLPARRQRREPPPPWRIWAVLGAAVLLLLSILMTIRRMLSV